MNRSNALYFISISLAVVLAYIAFFNIYGFVIAGRLYVPIVTFAYLIGELTLVTALLFGAAKLSGRVWFIVAFLFAVVVALINSSQIISIAKFGNYIDLDAFANFEHIGFVIDKQTIFLTTIFVSFAVAVAFFASRAKDVPFKVIVSPVFLIIVFMTLSREIVSLRFIGYEFKANQKSYVAAFVSIAKSGVTPAKHVELDDNDLAIAKEYGIVVNPDETYPVVQKQIYSYKRDKPNVVVLFIESLGSSLLGKGYTPNIDKFLRNSFEVKNYYNHAYPTVAGLRGQLCSQFSFMAHVFERRLLVAPKDAELYCLPHILSDNGYQTIYFSHENAYRTYSKSRMEAVGFGEMQYIVEILSKHFPGKKPTQSNTDLGDEQMLNALKNEMIERDGKQFFMALSTIGTHANNNTVDFNETTNPVKTAINRFDTYFGEFMDWFDTYQFKKETLIILTSDHAHPPNREYIEAAGEGYVPNTINPVVLGIHSSQNRFRGVFEANSTSIDLAPTILDIVGVGEVENSHLLGHSIFSQMRPSKTLAATRSHMMIIEKSTGKLTRGEPVDFPVEQKIISYLGQLEKENRLIGSRNSKSVPHK